MAHKKRVLISLDDYESKIGDLEKLQMDLQNSLRPIIFEISSMQELLYEALKSFKQIKTSVRNTEGSIEKHAAKVLDKFGLLRAKARVIKITKNGSNPLKNKNDQPVDLFKRWVLGYDKLPLHQLNFLKPQTENHLKEHNELIKDYEQHEEIISFLDNKKTERNHRTRTIIDFYNRCLRKRQSILDYYLTGVYERALEKSRVQLLSMGILNWLDNMRDFPYNRNSRDVDYRKIDCVSHRIRDFYIDEADDLEKLYLNNKERFYKRLFRKRSKEQIFQNIEFNLSHIPLSNDRKEIFQELKQLFKGRRWLPFYALALPQVEGLFAEMVSTANPDKKTTNSLSEKVKFVRSGHTLKNLYFDYYQYELPKQRNSFSHTGYGKGFKLKAYDLLTDLEHILDVFAGLDYPYVRINIMIKKRDQMQFTNAEDFVQYFELLNNLHPTQAKEKQSEISDFTNEFLLKYCSPEYIIEESIHELQKDISGLRESINHYFKGYDFHNNFDSLTKPQIEKLQKKEEFCELTKEFFWSSDEKVQKVFIIRDFFQGVKKHLFKENIDPDIQTIFKIWELHKKFVRNLEELKKIVAL